MLKPGDPRVHQWDFRSGSVGESVASWRLRWGNCRWVRVVLKPGVPLGCMNGTFVHEGGVLAVACRVGGFSFAFHLFQVAPRVGAAAVQVGEVVDFCQLTRREGLARPS